MAVELGQHQLKAVRELKNGAILKGDVGSGKSRAAIAYFYVRECRGELKVNGVGEFKGFNTPKDLYIITTARKRDDLDWEKECAPFALGKERDGSVGGIKVTIDSWNNILKYKQVKDAFFIFDEQRLVGSGAWVKSFLEIAKHNRWIILSATPGDNWMDYIPVFVANGYYKNRTEFIRRHVVYNNFAKFPKVDHYVDTAVLHKMRRELIIDMPYSRHTKRHVQTVPVGHDKELLEKVVKERWHVYEERPIRDVAELFSVMRKVVNSDTSRTDSLAELLLKHRRLIVFYNFDYELAILRHWSENLMIPSSRSSRAQGSTASEKRPGSSPQEISTTSASISAGQTSDSQSLSSVTSNGILSEETSTVSATSEKSYGRIECDGSMSAEISDAYSDSYKKLRSVPTAEWNGHKHEQIPDGDTWLYFVQYTAGAEGWNCTSTDATVFYSLNYSWKINEQSRGRIDRLNTKYIDLYYYIFRSNSQIDHLIWKAIQGKKDFNESVYRGHF